MRDSCDPQNTVRSGGSDRRDRLLTLKPGEVYVLNDGGEVDLDLGNYERYLDVTLSKDNNITTGKIYTQVIEREVSLFLVLDACPGLCLHPAQGRISREDCAGNNEDWIEFCLWSYFHCADRTSLGERNPGLDRTRLQNTCRRHGRRARCVHCRGKFYYAAVSSS